MEWQLLKPPRSDQGWLFEGFFKNHVSVFYFCHHMEIYSFRNWFTCLAFGYFIYNKDFFAFCMQDLFHILHSSTNYETNSVGHLFYRGTPGFWNHVTNVKCKQCNDTPVLAQKYSPVFKGTLQPWNKCCLYQTPLWAHLEMAIRSPQLFLFTKLFNFVLLILQPITAAMFA